MKPLMASLTWPFRHLPIPWSLFLLISTVLAIGFGLAFVNLQESQGVLRTWEEESQLHLVERMARETDQIFDHYSQGVQNFSAATANALQLTGIEGAFRFFLAQQTLQKTLRDNPQYAVIAITDGLGRTLADRSSSNLDPLQFDDYFALGRKAGFQGQRYVSPLILMEGFSFPFVVFSEPVTDAGGTHVAVVCVVIQLEALVNQIVSTVPKWHRVFLCDDQGRLIATTAGSENSEPALGQPGDDFTFHPLVQRFMQNGRRWNELVAYDRADLTYLGTFSVTRTLPWMVASEVPERIAFSAISQMQRRLLAWFAFIVGLSLALTLLLVFAFRKPLQQLVKGANDLIHLDFQKQIEVDASNEFGQLAQTFNQMRASILDYIEQIKKAAQKNKETFIKALQALIQAIDAKDPYTKGHSQRVSKYSVIIARELGQSVEELEKTELSALLHDVGKIGIEDKILKKPAPLTNAEYTIMKKHPEKGMAILGAIDELREITDGVGLHHENWDGKGYPNGLKGEEIPLQARIVAVADAFDAMTTNRPYQIAMSHDAAISRLQDLAGLRFDPTVVQALSNAYFAGRL